MAIPSIGTQQLTPPADQISNRSESLDRADFLKMLMTQVRFQDPLSPMSNEEFASQMAQFSSLQELQKIGGYLDQSLQANLLLSQTFNNTMSTALIGKVVKANTNELTVTGIGDSELNYQLADAATDISIEILDSEGTVVRTVKLNAQQAGEHSFTWDGVNSNGQEVAPGDYTFKVSAKDADGNTVEATTFVEGTITGVNYENGNVRLQVGDLIVELGQVIAILSPDDKRNG